ncbi:MAG: helix-turn-helix domain-containing protein [Clostridia bacterium]|nr:helix-turn-helix domain-containing protein [Clostridia bacterium]
MDMLRQLNDAIAHIEANICEEIDMEAVARVACTSADGFSRYFSYLTGMTVNEYIRRRRLTLAAYELRARGGRVIDVAVKYGYNSADAFTKAFAKQHGVTPKEARDAHCPLNVFLPVSFHIVIEGARQMNFKLMEREAIEVYGLSRQCAEGTRDEERDAMWDINRDFVSGDVSNYWEGVWYGIWNESRYSIARDRADITGENLERMTIPAGTYAVFTSERGPSAKLEIPRLHDLIFHSWLPDSGYERSADLEVEVYHLHTDQAERRRNRYYEIWIPVRKCADDRG